MKMYILPNRILLVGKAWEIRHKLKEYARHYATVSGLLVHIQKQENR
ncbi:MAG: Z-ring formation inhibitor MciZ [Ectobacillus sp.]